MLSDKMLLSLKKEMMEDISQKDAASVFNRWTNKLDIRLDFDDALMAVRYIKGIRDIDAETFTDIVSLLK